jgi:hypothetical protein
MNQQKAERSKLEKAAASTQESEVVEVPRVKYGLSLYTNISNIRWDYKTQKVAGCKFLFQFDKQTDLYFLSYLDAREERHQGIFIGPCEPFKSLHRQPLVGSN